MRSNGQWLGEVVLTRVDASVVPARVIGVATNGVSLQVVIDTENATIRTWLDPAPVSEIIELEDGHYVTRAAAIWPNEAPQ